MLAILVSSALGSAHAVAALRMGKIKQRGREDAKNPRGNRHLSYWLTYGTDLDFCSNSCSATTRCAS
jgi:hypothetical protein